MEQELPVYHNICSRISHPFLPVCLVPDTGRSAFIPVT